MPRGDGTGPMGLGPMTGRRAGLCAGYPVPGYMNPVGRWGFWGRGRGGGQGWRNWFDATGLTGWQRAALGWPAWGGLVPPVAYTAGPEAQLEALRNHAQFLQEALEGVRKRIAELESKAAKQ